MHYKTPVDDFLFVFRFLAGLDEVLALPAHAGLDGETIEAILTENARFVDAVVAPLNRIGDRQPARLVDGKVTTSPGFAQAFTEFGAGGWQGLQHDAQWNGQGLPKLLSAATSEALNGACLAFALCPLLTDGVIEALATAGSPELCQQYIPPLVQGRWTGTMNLTEPDAGSDLARVTTKATQQADGSYRLHGQKIFITYGEHDMAENIVHLVLARTPDAPEGVKGLSLFIVPKFLVNADGTLGSRNDIVCASIEHKLGIHGSPTAVLLYGSGQGEVGEGAIGYRVGEENRGLQYMFIMMNAARYAVGLQGVALGERALQQATQYAAERVQGQDMARPGTPALINRHPDVQRLLLTMRALTEANRASALYAAALADKAAAHADAAERTRCLARYHYLVPVIKGFSTESAVEVCSLGIQVHGGMGYIEETGAAQYYRDARILPIYEGTTAIQANDFIGRKIMHDKGAVAFAMADDMRQTVVTLRALAEGARQNDKAESTPVGSEASGQPTALSGSQALTFIAARLDAAIDVYISSIRQVLDGNARPADQQAEADATRQSDVFPHNLQAAYMGSVPLLMLAGIVHGGWQMARAAVACHQQAQAEADSVFNKKKLATAVFYAANILPRAQMQTEAILAAPLSAYYATEFFNLQ